MNTQAPQDGQQLQIQIERLITHLEEKVSTLKSSHIVELDSLTKRCRLDMQKVHHEFTSELDRIEQKHNLHLAQIADEIAYLKEMSQSQRMMMETNLAYIKELEVRYLSLTMAKQS